MLIYRFFQFIFKVAIVILIFIEFAFAAEPALIIPLRGQEASLCEAKGCRMVRTRTREFDNGNTFVQFEDDVRGKSLSLILTEGMSANTQMEALIKIRTAKSMGAKYIQIICQESPRDSFAQRLFISGADVIVDTTSEKKNFRPKAMAIQPQETGADFEIEPRSKLVVLSETHQELGKQLAGQLGVDFLTSAEALLETSLNDRKLLRVIMLESVAVPVNENLFKTLDRVEELSKIGIEVVLVTPYFPYSRSDKIDQFGVAATGRLVADLIEGSGAQTAVFTRLHAPQAQGFFRIPTIHITGRQTIVEYLEKLELDAVISPDAGFQKEASLYADKLNVPVYVLNKQRDPKTGKSEIRKMGNFRLKNATVAVIDDETASGGTLGDAAQFLKKQGANRVIGVVTHLAGNAQKALNSPYLDELVVTNTLPVNIEPHAKLKVLSIGNEMVSELQGIREVTGSSCSDLLMNLPAPVLDAMKAKR